MNRDDEMEKKKAEVRARLVAQSASRKKNGFMTQERKKKLRLLLKKAAAERLKKEQEEKEAERRRVISQRCGQPKKVDTANQDDLMSLCQEYYKRICQIESAKFDIEKDVELKDYQINDLNLVVSDLRGKFLKPSLKKVSKYENKFAKLQKKAAEFNFRNRLKTVKKKEFSFGEEDPVENKKPNWALGEKESSNKTKGPIVEEQASDEVVPPSPDPIDLNGNEGVLADSLGD